MASTDHDDGHAVTSVHGISRALYYQIMTNPDAMIIIASTVSPAQRKPDAMASCPPSAWEERIPV